MQTDSIRPNTQHWTMRETLVEDLEKLLCLEKAFMMTLPSMAQSASSADLQREFERLTGDTREQIARLRGMITPSSTSQSYNIEEQLLHEEAEPALMDGMLIAEARKKQHAKIALYSTVCLWARQLGLNDMEKTLAQNLQAEELNCEKLLQLAQQVTRPTA